MQSVDGPFHSKMAVFILQTNYPSRPIMRRTFNATSIKTGRITGRTRRQRTVDMSLSGAKSNSKRMYGSMINKNGGQTITFIEVTFP